MRHQYNFIRLDEIRAMLAEIENAQGADSLGALYVRHIGYDPYKEPGDVIEDDEEIRMNLTDYVKEVAFSEGFTWSDIEGIELR